MQNFPYPIYAENLQGENTGDETVTTIGELIDSATAKTTPVDADLVPIADSADSFILKKLTWANLKATYNATLNFIQSGTGAVGRTWLSKTREKVTVEDFGAVGDGVTDDTTAVQAALTAGKHVEFTASTYKVGQLNIPSTCRKVFSKNGSKLIPAASVPSGATVADWITATTVRHGEISGLWLSATSATYPNLTCISLLACVDFIVEKNRIDEAGRVAIYGGNCVLTTVRNNDCREFSLTGIKFEGSSQSSIDIHDNLVDGTGTAHCISAQLGDFIKIRDNTVKNAQTFGIAAYQVSNAIISGNDCFNTQREGVNTEDSSLVSIIGNTCRWPTSSSNSTDFGISVFGNAESCQFVIVEDNIIIRPGASGIALAGGATYGVVDSIVANNSVTNCNQTSIANHCGILLYGSATLRNAVIGNTITDTAGTKHTYGVGEINFGTGQSGSSKITGNQITGFVTSAVSAATTSLVVYHNATSVGVQGDLEMVGSSRLIKADFSNATLANRTMIQSSTTNGATTVSIKPNGTSTSVATVLEGDSATTNGAIFVNQLTAADARLNITVRGTGTQFPLRMQIGSADALVIDTSKNVTVQTGNLILPKTSGVGIKVDSTTPTFGWRDILGQIVVKAAGANDPTWSVFRGSISAYQFSNALMNQVWVILHIPHDYVPSTDLYMHVHWAQITVDTGGTAGVPGVAKWYFDITYADGHGTAGGAADPFIAPYTVSVTQQGATTQYGHMIAEVQITGASLAASTIQPDGLLMVRVYRDPADVADTLNQAPFLLMSDCHYQSTNIGTKQKSSAGTGFYV